MLSKNAQHQYVITIYFFNSNNWSQVCTQFCIQLTETYMKHVLKKLILKIFLFNLKLHLNQRLNTIMANSTK